MKRISRVALAIAVALIAVTSLSAATWVWSTPYDNVTGYRYQIGSESEEGWIYVGSDVTSLTLDSKEETTIYVQLTVDNGRFWSPSGVATYVPQSVPTVENLTNQAQTVVGAEVAEEEVLPVIDEAVAEEEPIEEIPVEEAVVEETPVEEDAAIIGEADELTDIVVTDEEVPEEETVEETAEAVEEEFVEEPVEEEVVYEEEPVEEAYAEEEPEFVEVAPIEKKGRNFAFGMDIAITPEITTPDLAFSIQPVLGFNFKNVASPADWFGLDLDLNLIGLFTPDANLKTGGIGFFKDLLASKFAMGGAAELVLRPTFHMNSFEIGVLLGGGANFYAGSTITEKNAASIPSLYKNDAININAYALAGIDFRYNFNDTFNMGLGYRFKYTFDQDIKNGSKMSHSPMVSMGFTF